jgi:hypothetical protein
VPKLAKSGRRGKIFSRLDQIAYRFTSTPFQRLAQLFCVMRTSGDPSALEVNDDAIFGGVSLRAIDAAADSPKRMIALTEYIRFIFIQEEAWGFRPTPSI